MKPIVDSLQEFVSQVSSRIEKLNNQYLELEAQLSENMESMDSSDGTTTSQGITTDLIANIAYGLANEEKENEKRQFNLICIVSKNLIPKKVLNEKIRILLYTATSILKDYDYLDVTVSITKCLQLGKNMMILTKKLCLLKLR